MPDPEDYACAITSMIKWWRIMFSDPSLWFGFVQIASYNYGPTTAGADLRQAQLAALRLDRVGMSTAIDTGAWDNIHPPDKQVPSRRRPTAPHNEYVQDDAGEMLPFIHHHCRRRLLLF